MLYKIVN